MPAKLSSALRKSELNSTQVKKLSDRNEELKKKVEAFLKKTEPLRNDVESRFEAIKKLEEVLVYLRTYEHIDDMR